MDPRFLPHNTHLEEPLAFRDRDPQLRHLKRLPKSYRPPLLDSIPRDAPGVYTLGGGRQVGKTTLLKLWMAELLEERQTGKEAGDPSRLRLDAGEIARHYPENTFPGHAAWLDWPWKLHRIHNKKGQITLELYNLAKDPQEKNNLLTQQSGRVKSMKSQLEDWQKSVVRSLNGKDYG